MQKEYIDVEYTEIPNDEKSQQDPNITINTNPLSALISGMCSIANGITNGVKEYNMCRQQEQTKRTAIKAQMKVQMEQINAQKELYLSSLEKAHTIQLEQIRHQHEECMLILKDLSDTIHCAIDVAKETKNFSDVCMLLQEQRQTFIVQSEMNLKYMEMSGYQSNQMIQNNIAGLLK